MDEVQDLFSEFERQVGEITSHAQQVHKIDFSAKLRNGTYFNFSYNSDTYNRKFNQEGKRSYNPGSVFNAVVDIVGSSAAITLLVILALVIKGRPAGFGKAQILVLLSYSCFTAFFIISSLYHLFNRESEVRFVFYNVKETLKVLALGCANIALSMLASFETSSSVLFFTLLIGSVSILLLSLGTQGGAKASLAFCVVLPYLPLYANLTLSSVTTATLFGLWSLVSLVAKPGIRIKSNSTLAIIGILSLLLNLLALL